MSHLLKGRHLVCAAISASLFILAGIPVKAAKGALQDPFTGDWLLSLHSAPGPEVSSDEMTVALKISKKGNFYKVSLEIPSIYAETEYGGFSWPKFVTRSDKSLKSMTAKMAKRKYNGDYLLDIDGGSITHQDGSVTFFQHKINSKLLCEKVLGCFSKGNQIELIKSYKEHWRNKVKAAAEARAEAKTRAEADAKARAEAMAAAKARAEAEAIRAKAFSGPFSEMSYDAAASYCINNGGRLPSIDELVNIHRNECLGGGGEECSFWFWSVDRMSVKQTIFLIKTNMKSVSYARCVQ